MTDFDKVTADYTPAEHLDCAREIAEALYLAIPTRFEIQVAYIVQHLHTVQVRVRSCDAAPSTPYP